VESQIFHHSKILPGFSVRNAHVPNCYYVSRAFAKNLAQCENFLIYLKSLTLIDRPIIVAMLQ